LASTEDEDVTFVRAGLVEPVMIVSVERGRLNMSVDVSFTDQTRYDLAVADLVRLTDDLFVSLAFAFGYIEAESDTPPGLSDAVEAGRLEWLFWTTYLGARFVDALGTEQLSHPPIGRAEALTTGAVKIVTRPDPFAEPDPEGTAALRTAGPPFASVRLFDASRMAPQ
jgi:hypothetical protein